MSAYARLHAWLEALRLPWRFALYAGVAFVVLVVAALAAITSHLTVVAYLHDIDMPGHAET